MWTFRSVLSRYVNNFPVDSLKKLARGWNAGTGRLERRLSGKLIDLMSRNNRSPEINAEKAGKYFMTFPLIAPIMFTADLLVASFVCLIIKNICFASAAKATNSSF